MLIFVCFIQNMSTENAGGDLNNHSPPHTPTLHLFEDIIVENRIH